jgi:hypothetical protein
MKGCVIGISRHVLFKRQRDSRVQYFSQHNVPHYGNRTGCLQKYKFRAQILL